MPPQYGVLLLEGPGACKALEDCFGESVALAGAGERWRVAHPHIPLPPGTRVALGTRGRKQSWPSGRDGTRWKQARVQTECTVGSRVRNAPVTCVLDQSSRPFPEAQKWPHSSGQAISHCRMGCKLFILPCEEPMPMVKAGKGAFLPPAQTKSPDPTMDRMLNPLFLKYRRQALSSLLLLHICGKAGASQALPNFNDCTRPSAPGPSARAEANRRPDKKGR